MDAEGRREWMRGWIALGLREGLTFKELARRSGLNRRTLARWAVRFRQEQAAKGSPDRDDRPFVELVERAGANTTRIEIVMRGERRIVVDGTAVIEALVRILTAVERC